MLNPESHISKSLVETLFTKYQNSPKTCVFCGAPVSFESYVRQFDKDLLFCSTDCISKFKDIEKSSDFIRNNCRSATELVILNYLKSTYPDLTIINNDKSLQPPYEFDFVFPEKNVIVEYNGVYHYLEHYGERRLRKVQSRDAQKKKVICSRMQWNCVCLCSPFGLYTRPNIFKKMLTTLSMKLDMLFSSFHYGYCSTITADEDESSILVTEESFLKNFEEKPKSTKKKGSKKYYNTRPGKKVNYVGLKNKSKKKKRR